MFFHLISGFGKVEVELIDAFSSIRNVVDILNNLFHSYTLLFRGVLLVRNER